MRAAPFNFLITFVLAGVLWVLTALVLSGRLSESVILNLATVDAFIQMYRVIVGVAALVGVGLCYLWYSYGARDTTVGEMGRAKRRWLMLFLTAMSLAVALLVALLVIFRAESFSAGIYATFAAVLSVHTWLFYWLCTLLMSPRTVKTLPWLA